MKSALKQTFRFTSIAAVVLGLAFFTAHQLRGSKTLKLSVQMESVPENIQRWVHAGRGAGEPDIAATGAHLLVRFPGSRWNPLCPIDSSATKIVASTRGQFVAVLRITRRPQPEVTGALSVEIRSTGGGQMGKWEMPWDYDRPLPALALLHDGSTLALGWADVGQVQIFRSGLPTPATVDLFQDDEYGLERSLYLACDDSSDQFLVLATRRGANPAGREPAERTAGAKLFWLSPEGHIVGTAPVDAEAVTAFHLDPDSRLIVVGGADFPTPDHPLPFAEIRTASGTPLTRVERITPEQFAVTPNRRFCVLADPSRAVAVDLTQRLELWRRNRGDETRSILDAAVLAKPTAVALLRATVLFRGGRFVYSNPEVSLVDTRGNEIGATALPETLAARARLVGGSDGRLRVLTQNRIWIISIAR